MASRNATVAQAVVDSLNAAVAAGKFSHPFAAERIYAPMWDLPDLVRLRVTVFGGGDDRVRISRGATSHELSVQVGVQQRLSGDVDPSSPAANEEIDALVELAEQIADHFKPGDWGGARWLRTLHPTLASPAHLIEHRTFTSLVIVSFQLFPTN